MQCGTHSKHFPTHQMRIRHLRHIIEDMKISILSTVPIGLMQKKSPATSTNARNSEHNKFVDYILPKYFANLAF